MNKAISILLLSMLITSCQEPEQINENYVLDKEWNEAVSQIDLGQIVGLDVDSDGNIFVFHRAGRLWSTPFPEENIANNTVALIDGQSGELLKSWGGNLFSMPHGLTVDQLGHVWLSDVGRHQVFKFNRDGKLLMELGEERVAGNDSQHFDQPTDIAISSLDSTVYISDGYGNSRVVKYSYSGEYLFDFGSKGTDSGSFVIPHAVTIDSKGIIYVADRENGRVQSFDNNGKLLTIWDDKSFGKIYSVVYNPKEDALVAIDYKVRLGMFPLGSDVIFLNEDGSYKERFGRSGNYEGEPLRFHDLAIDHNGSLYLGDILRNKLLKYKIY